MLYEVITVADHVDKVYGQALVPIDKFHIPALILGADIQPQTYTKIASQADLPTTLLGLLGKETWHPMTGRNLLQVPAEDPGRAIMQFGWHGVLLRLRLFGVFLNRLRENHLDY